MSFADHYIVLGVGRDANPSQIRRAYREQMHRHDLPGATADDLEQVRRIREAYETLSRSLERVAYNRALGEMLMTGTAAEPMAPPVDLLESFQAHRPGREAVRDLLARNFTGRGIPKSRPVSEINVELVLSAGQAARGGVIPIDVPVARVCPTCDGTGAAGHCTCDACDGHGLFWETARVEVVVPGHTADGTRIPVSLRHVGVTNAYLNLHVRVAQPTGSTATTTATTAANA